MTAATLAPPLDVRADLMHPLPKQEVALDSLYEHKYTLYGGAAGPGKSYWLRWAALEFLLECFATLGLRDVRVGLFCEDYPTLTDRQISKIKREFPAWLGALRGTRDEGFGFFLRPEYGGGYIALRNLDDPSKYASTEFAAVFVDELTKNKRQTFEDLRFRLRWPGLEHTPFAAATNPGSVGHGWVKKLWIDRDFTGDDQALNQADFAFVQALPGDNPHLGKSYWALLDSLPERMRRAMRDGRWDVFEGQAFPEFDRKIHVIEPFTIPADWTRWTSTDYGYVDPWATVWIARSPDRSRVVVYREGYQTGLTAREQARKIIAMTGNEPIRLNLGDPSMWAMRERYANEAIASEYAAEGVALQPANNDRLGGKAKVHEALRHDHGVSPRLQMFRSCPNLIRTLENIPLSETRPEDVDTHADDHLYDCVRYGLEVEGQRADPPASMRAMQIVGDEPKQAPRTIRGKIDAARKPVEQYGPRTIR